MFLLKKAFLNWKRRTTVTCFFFDHHSLTETAAPVTNAAILIRAARSKAKAIFST